MAETQEQKKKRLMEEYNLSVTKEASDRAYKEDIEKIRQNETWNVNEIPANNQPPGTDGANLPLVETTRETTDVGVKVTTKIDPPPQSPEQNIVTKSDLEDTGNPPPIGEGVTPGSFSVPRAGSRVWIFFHGGDIQKPVYFAQSIIPTGYTDHYSNPAPDPVSDITNNGSEGENTQPTNTDTVTGETTNKLIVEPPLPTEPPLPNQGESSTTNIYKAPPTSYTVENPTNYIPL